MSVGVHRKGILVGLQLLLKEELAALLRLKLKALQNHCQTHLFPSFSLLYLPHSVRGVQNCNQHQVACKFSPSLWQDTTKILVWKSTSCNNKNHFIDNHEIRLQIYMMLFALKMIQNWSVNRFRFTTLLITSKSGFFTYQVVPHRTAKFVNLRKKNYFQRRN